MLTHRTLHEQIDIGQPNAHFIYPDKNTNNTCIKIAIYFSINVSYTNNESLNVNNKTTSEEHNLNASTVIGTYKNDYIV